MTLHLHRGRWWPIVCTPSGALLNFQKVCIPGSVRSLLPAKPVLGGTSGLSVAHLILETVHRVYPDTVTAPRY